MAEPGRRLIGTGTLSGTQDACPGLDPGGGELRPDDGYYVMLRPQRTIGVILAALDEKAAFLLPEGVARFPRGSGFGNDGRLYS